MWTLLAFSVLSNSVRQSLAAEALLDTFRISPGPLGLEAFLKDEQGQSCLHENKRPRAGEKWQLKFDQYCSELGPDILMKNDEFFYIILCCVWRPN